MNQDLSAAFCKGYERMAAWSGLIDDINLYPVADADTGRNLRISLAPLRSVDNQHTARRLLISATGNSGNIAGAFFSKFIQIESFKGLSAAAATGKDAAWQALKDPKPGTMLSVFDALTDAIQLSDSFDACHVMDNIKNAVLATAQVLPELKNADVVDAGALGMFLFFEGFFKDISNHMDSLCNPHYIFGTKLSISTPITAACQNSYCIDSVIVPSADIEAATQKISAMGEHVVAVSDGKRLKIHLHTTDVAKTRKDLTAVGDLLRWDTEKIESRNIPANRAETKSATVHIVTDAAGSLTLDAARDLGVTLLASYIIMDEHALPESALAPEALYGAMKMGKKVTTAQASIFERHQHYQYLAHCHEKLIYLCVGSVYTGNYEIAAQWALLNSPNGQRMTVMDTGAASGRLGLIARRVAKYANSGNNMVQVVQYASTVARACDEIIFLDQLKFLAASGRISKSSSFFGDLLKIKPIIRPAAAGAQKIGVVKSREAQVDFALDHLGKRLNTREPVEILLQYTDNQDRVVSHIQPQIRSLLPFSRISVEPMSLTSGVHMGPGTWAVAFLPK